MGLALRLIAAAVLFAALSGCAGKASLKPPEDIEPGAMFAEAGRGGELSALAAPADYVLVGEGHTVLCDHKVQAAVMESLADFDPAVGLEMVSVERQDALERFNAGELSVEELRDALDWDRTWGHSFRGYVPIFEAAKRLGLDLYALNVPRSVVKAVSDGGVEGVPEDLRQYLPKEVINPAPEQIAELRAVFDAHPPRKSGKGEEGAGTFERFLLVQSLWDTAMAENVVRVRRETGAPVIVLAGAGHVEYGLGIARRIEILEPGAKTVTMTPWRGNHAADAAAGDVFFFCPPSHTAKDGYTMAFRPDGVFIADVEPGSRAEAAGFRIGDRIVGINGQSVAGVGEMFRAMFRAERKERPVSFMLRREGGLAVAVLGPEEGGEEDAGTP
jgi:uncharacterized iron-regulated protein